MGRVLQQLHTGAKCKPKGRWYSEELQEGRKSDLQVPKYRRSDCPLISADKQTSSMNCFEVEALAGVQRGHVMDSLIKAQLESRKEGNIQETTRTKSALILCGYWTVQSGWRGGCLGVLNLGSVSGSYNLEVSGVFLMRFDGESVDFPGTTVFELPGPNGFPKEKSTLRTRFTRTKMGNIVRF